MPSRTFTEEDLIRKHLIDCRLVIVFLGVQCEAMHKIKYHHTTALYLIKIYWYLIINCLGIIMLLKSNICVHYKNISKKSSILFIVRTETKQFWRPEISHIVIFLNNLCIFNFLPTFGRADMAETVGVQTRFQVWVSPILKDMWKCVNKKGSAAMWWSSGQQVLHQIWIWGIYCTQVSKHAGEGSTLALKARADVTRSLKQGMIGPTKRTDTLQNL